MFSSIKSRPLLFSCAVLASRALLVRGLFSLKYIWERLAVGFKHKNFRSREGVCLCLIATLNIYGAQPLILSKLVPHLCTAFGDSNSQVRDAAILAIVEVYRHVGEKLSLIAGDWIIPEQFLLALRIQTPVNVLTLIVVAMILEALVHIAFGCVKKYEKRRW
ncbi:hypothetical protein llap_20246 [Limosa lapponica baueri]|uniref:TOG domain-containing protein n=1 Tax=Limosa lapponica baueri TaxID=1758121 RepID=A0A2I0T6N5_LIMLA|nr:hypothetical protein llap_20246 [Limosa lapponica baueri]